MQFTGKYISVSYQGVSYTLFNQRSREWTHPYEYQGNGSKLCNAGCGIFSTLHAAQYLGGACVLTPEELADFSCKTGGRGDDGTDRPALLSAMEQAGLARQMGFSYHGDGLRNNLEALHDALMQGDGALCNLRPGHIVALIGARMMDGEKQVLAADPYSESADERLRGVIRECISGSEIVSRISTPDGIVCGALQSYALYWAALKTVRDFNLLHRL